MSKLQYLEDLEALQVLNKNRDDYNAKDYSDCGGAYVVDIHNRLVYIPETIGVEGDHASTAIYFAIDKEYDYVNLAELNGVIQYVTPDKQNFIYPIEGFDVTSLADKNKLIFKWQINYQAYKEPGTLFFYLKLYKIGNKQPLYISNGNEYEQVYKYDPEVETYYYKIIEDEGKTEAYEPVTDVSISSEESFDAYREPYYEYCLNFQPSETKISLGLPSLGYVPFEYDKKQIIVMQDKLDTIEEKIKSNITKRKVFWTNV